MAEQQQKIIAGLMATIELRDNAIHEFEKELGFYHSTITPEQNKIQRLENELEFRRMVMPAREKELERKLEAAEKENSFMAIDCQNMMQDRDNSVTENKRLRDGLDECFSVIDIIRDIEARTKEIIYHHTVPKKSRHGNTTRTCEDMLSRAKIARVTLQSLKIATQALADTPKENK